MINVKDLQSKIEKALEKGEAVSRHTNDVKENIEELKLCKAISESPKRLRGETLKVFSDLVEETVNELHEKIREFFSNKKNVDEIVSPPYKDDHADDVESERFVQTPLDDFDLEEELDGLESVLPEGEMWSEELIRKARQEVALAQARKALAKESHKRGAKVKRVPPRKGFDAADVAAALGMEDLAKELTIEYPKPFVPTKKDGPVTRREYYVKSTYDDCVQNNELKNAFEKALANEANREFEKNIKAVIDYENNKPRERFDSKRIKNAFDKGFNTEAVSAFYKNKPIEVEKLSRNDTLAVVESLEKLVGKLTTEKLAAERKLALAELALKEAGENLRKLNITNILEASEMSLKESVTDKLTRDFEEAFRDRKF